MKKLAYGMEEPGPDDRPTLCRSTNLEQVKKAISYFMPNKQHWVQVPAGQVSFGNPTMSNDVKQVIAAVKMA